MVDAIKIAVKAGLIALVTAGILVLFSTIQIPALDYSSFSTAVNSGVAVMFNWFPITRVLLPLAVSIIALRVAIFTFEITSIAVRWIFKINE